MNSLEINTYKNAYKNASYAFYIIKAIKTENDTFDYIFRYANSAFAALVGKDTETFLNKRFSEFYKTVDPKWDKVYGKIAFDGGNTVIVEQSKEINKCLRISCYQIKAGYCGCLLTDVTEEYLLEQQVLEQSQELKKRYDQVLEIYNSQTNGLIWFDDGDKLPLKFVNNTMVEVFGYNSKTELIESEHLSLCEYIYPDDLEILLQHITEVDTLKTALCFEIRLISIQGETSWYRATLEKKVALSGSMLYHLSLNDISSLKKLEQQLVDEKNAVITQFDYFNKILTTVPSGIAVYDSSTDGTTTISYLNDEMELLTGYSKQELLDMSPSQVCEADAGDKYPVEAAMRYAMKTQTVAVVEYSTTTKCGENKYVQVRAKVAGMNGKISQNYVTYTDITSLK